MGVIEGKVTRVATDAVPEPDARQLEGQPDRQLQSTMPIGHAQRVQNLVFPVTVVPDVASINVGDPPCRFLPAWPCRSK